MLSTYATNNILAKAEEDSIRLSKPLSPSTVEYSQAFGTKDCVSTGCGASTDRKSQSYQWNTQNLTRYENQVSKEHGSLSTIIGLTYPVSLNHSE